MALQEVDLVVGTTPSSPTGVPQNCQYMTITSNSATATISFTINGVTPVINGAGQNLAALGSYTFQSASGATFPIGSLKIVASAASSSVTIFFQ